jgi:hypothetical protein
MEKKNGNINVHIPADVEAKVRQLGELTGVSASEYVANLIQDHLAHKEYEFSVMQRIFGGNGSDSSASSR